VVEQRRRGQQAAIERARVEKWLQRRARLTVRLNAVDVARTGEIAAAGDVREYVAARIVDDQHRGVARPAVADGEELPAQRGRGVALRLAVERRASIDARRGARP